VSVTTDGFITNLPNLEDRLKEKYLFTEFKNIRHLLTDDNTGLELKNDGKGIIA
jgi:hypothetical protein